MDPWSDKSRLITAVRAFIICHPSIRETHAALMDDSSEGRYPLTESSKGNPEPLNMSGKIYSAYFPLVTDGKLTSLLSFARNKDLMCLGCLVNHHIFLVSVYNYSVAVKVDKDDSECGVKMNQDSKCAFPVVKVNLVTGASIACRFCVVNFRNVSGVH